MSLAQRNKAPQQACWQPTASLKNLRQRAKIIAKIRQFFAERNILEVETPLLSNSATTNPYTQSFQCEHFYLQTSPEFAMKRLLAAGSGDIYQISKAFRHGEQGNMHNPEFTMLEWYRIGFDHHQLISEVNELLQLILKTEPAEKLSYQALFERFFNINPRTCLINDLEDCAKRFKLNVPTISDADDWLNLLLSHIIEPKLGHDKPVFVYDYPSSQAELAKIREQPYPVAERFECYYQGIELVNGFHELCDATIQRQRFVEENQKRNKLGLAQMPIDECLLTALANGFPSCAGVALGIDRLIMLAINRQNIQDVITFPMDRA